MFFELEMTISQNFPSLSPIQLRREISGEVFKLMKRMAARNAKENEKYTVRNGQRIRRRKATTWY